MLRGKLWPVAQVFCPQFCRHAQVVTYLPSPPMASGWAPAADRRELCPWTQSHRSCHALVHGGCDEQHGERGNHTKPVLTALPSTHYEHYWGFQGGLWSRKSCIFFPWAIVSLWSYAHCKSHKRFSVEFLKKPIQISWLSHINSLPLARHTSI